MTSEAKPPFDAARFMRKIRTRQGEQDYLPLWPRVQWLRYDHPTAQVETVEVLANDKVARFKCVIHLPDGAIAVGHGQCEQKDFGDFYEKAESTALGRALAILGYGTDAVDLEGAPPDHVPRVQMGDRLTEKQQAYLAVEALKRGIRLSDKPQMWSTVLGVLSKAGVNLDGVADDAGIIAEEVANRVLALSIVRQPGSAPPAASRPQTGSN